MAPLNGFAGRSSNRRLQIVSRASRILPRVAARRGLDLDTTAGIIFFVILIITAIGLLFCLVVGMIMVKNKVQMRKRQKRMEAMRPKNQQQYAMLHDQESNSQYQGIQELPSDNQIYDPVPFRTVELQGDTGSAPQAHQLDGIAAPPRNHSRPVELPTMADPATASVT